MIRCTNCSTLNRDKAQFCTKCGVLLAASTPHRQLSLGSVLYKRYKITRIIGQGGMGTIYLAQDTNLANRECVVKEMLDQFTDPQERAEAIRGFQQEADILSRLRHDNIPQIHDRFSEGGKHYLVMEFVDGEDLDKIIESRSSPLPEGQAIDWAIQLCKVLDYLHNRTPPIVYRDLKPGNIMLTRDGKIKLIDFGIARLFKKGKAQDTEALGTVGYSPPEQWGKGQTDARSDIYSLGATMHYLLTKKDPQNFPPFSFDQRLPRAINSSISEGMEMIVMKAVEQDSSRRYQRARQLLQDLENLKQGIGPAPPLTLIEAKMCQDVDAMNQPVGVKSGFADTDQGFMVWLKLSNNDPYREHVHTLAAQYYAPSGQLHYRKQFKLRVRQGQKEIRAKIFGRRIAGHKEATMIGGWWALISIDGQKAVTLPFDIVSSINPNRLEGRITIYRQSTRYGTGKRETHAYKTLEFGVTVASGRRIDCHLEGWMNPVTLKNGDMVVVDGQLQADKFIADRLTGVAAGQVWGGPPAQPQQVPQAQVRKAAAQQSGCSLFVLLLLGFLGSIAILLSRLAF